jgi:predicted AlkP superfamily phosphohydrolase/phosphomutase
MQGRAARFLGETARQCIVLLAALSLLACSGGSGERRRVLFVGLDGATLRLIDPLLEQGRLPHLAEIARSGVSGPLRSEPPLLSPRIWNTVATSKPPAEHGILGWVWLDDSGTPRLYTGNDRKVHALWNIVSDADLRVGVVNWLTTQPPSKVNGVVVSDHMFPAMVDWSMDFSWWATRLQYPNASLPLVSPGHHVSFAYPPEWMARVAALRDVTDPLTQIADPFAGDAVRMGPSRSAELSLHYRADEFAARVALAVDEAVRPDLLMVYLPGIDKVSHHLWRSVEDQRLYPEALRRPPELRAVRARALESYYEFVDALLGRLLEGFAASDLVMVVSDHGFEAEVIESPTAILTGGHSSPLVADGILFARGRGVWRGERVFSTSIYDVTPTVLAWLGLPVGEDMQGRVAHFLEARPVATVTTHDVRPVERLGGASPEVEDAIVEQLRGLGYVE